MASLWTLFTKGYAEYEMEKMQEPAKKTILDLTFKQGFYNCGDYEIQESHKYAKDLGDSAREKLLYDELKRRGLKPLD